MYLLAAKILAPIALLLGLWWWHTNAVSTAHKAGKAEVMAEWQTSDKIALAVGTAKTELLARDAVRNREKLIEVQTENAKRAAVGAAALADRTATIVELRSALAKPPTAQANGNPACTPTGGDDTSLRSCHSLLDGSLTVAAGADRLVAKGESLLKSTGSQVTSLQEYATLVQSVK
jgi:hypothetical protein